MNIFHKDKPAAPSQDDRAALEAAGARVKAQIAASDTLASAPEAMARAYEAALRAWAVAGATGPLPEFDTAAYAAARAAALSAVVRSAALRAALLQLGERFRLAEAVYGPLWAARSPA